MRHFWTACCAAFLLVVAGCSGSDEGEPVATTEDEFAAFDAMVAAEEEQTAEDEAAYEEN